MNFFPHNQLLLCGKFDIIVYIYGLLFYALNQRFLNNQIEGNYGKL